MYLSLLTGLAFLVPLPVFGVSVHISLTFSKTKLQCLSKAFTLANNLWLFLQLMSTCNVTNKKYCGLSDESRSMSAVKAANCGN